MESRVYPLLIFLMEKLKKLKKSMISWAKEKSLRDEVVVKSIDIELEAL